MAEKLVGKISHYYDKIGVAVVDLTGTLKQGDEIVIKKGGEAFSQTVDSMQIEHDKVMEAKAGQSIGMKIVQPVRPVAQVFRVVEGIAIPSAAKRPAVAKGKGKAKAPARRAARKAKPAKRKAVKAKGKPAAKKKASKKRGKKG
ncbi:MAG: hypothetical protein V1676_01350 [Candidatus Diapherotrites archaeon]